MAQLTDDTHRTAAKVKQASLLFREFYIRCFWHLKPDLVVTRELLPLIVEGLRKHGGRAGMLAAARLLE